MRQRLCQGRHLLPRIEFPGTALSKAMLSSKK